MPFDALQMEGVRLVVGDAGYESHHGSSAHLFMDETASFPVKEVVFAVSDGSSAHCNSSSTI
ncbi:hypothetical protein E2C01_070830 [Portunus trituberculatus]|uniref:Uncharacterized protein n=1 Tax=Portunus trituberculatus TaxID=210409 RepID=A0A5B7HV89_PORTR|nr:hypothetical protein [Portunus trituberculatus]